jgi:hypothetical protein
MALGGLLVVVALIGAGLYMPGHKKASASEAVEAPKVIQETPAPIPSAAPTPAPEAKAPVVHAKPKRLADDTAAAAAAAAAERKAQLDQVEHEIDQLTGRAGAVNASLNTMQRQQAAAGYGLRGDMASAQARLNLNLQKAQNAIQAEDLDRAKRYAAQAATDLEVLERFLGR